MFSSEILEELRGTPLYRAQGERCVCLLTCRASHNEQCLPHYAPRASVLWQWCFSKPHALLVLAAVQLL